MGVHLRKDNCAFTKTASILFPHGNRVKMLAQGFLDVLLTLLPISNIFPIFELSAKAAFAKAAFDTLRMCQFTLARSHQPQQDALCDTFAALQKETGYPTEPKDFRDGFAESSAKKNWDVQRRVHLTQQNLGSPRKFVLETVKTLGTDHSLRWDFR